MSVGAEWVCRDARVGLDKPVFMGILNVTPDSFSDGGTHNACIDDALAHAQKMLDEGARIIDIGGESTKPGFVPVPAEEEMRRVVPVVKALRDMAPDVVISVDTMKAAVAESVMRAGADIINDVAGLADPRMAAVARDTGAGLVLMHGYAAHVGAEAKPAPGGFGRWVIEGLTALADSATRAGIAPERLCVDPGFGFGKKMAENGEVLDAVPALVAACPLPVLIGGSRKHFVSTLFPADSVAKSSAAFALKAYAAGGKIFRVHDVIETCILFAAHVQSSPTI